MVTKEFEIQIAGARHFNPTLLPNKAMEWGDPGIGIRGINQAQLKEQGKMFVP